MIFLQLRADMAKLNIAALRPFLKKKHTTWIKFVPILHRISTENVKIRQKIVL